MTIYTRLVPAFATVAAFATAAPVVAQDVLRAHVPFEFSVENTNLPRDTYHLSRMAGHPEMLFLRGDRTGAFVRINEVSLPRDTGAPSLLFHRYGDQYFLREVRWEGTARLDLPETKAERSAAEGRRNQASAKMEKVIVTAAPR